MSNRLDGKVALVIGAGSSGAGVGNGRAISWLFAREGASIMGADRDLAAAAETRRVIEEEGGECAIFEADVTSSDDIRALVETCIDRFGRIDVLINNVGIGEMGGPVELSEEAWDRSFAVNVKSMFLACKYVLPIMERQGGGTIVNISSVAGIRWGGVPYVAYGASKAAVNGFTQHVALQYASKNIRVNTVLPGLMNTPMIVEPLAKFYGDATQMIAQRDRMCPTGSMGEAWDVAYAALFLASDESKYVTGTELVVDGGISQQIIAPIH